MIRYLKVKDSYDGKLFHIWGVREDGMEHLFSKHCTDDKFSDGWALPSGSMMPLSLMIKKGTAIELTEEEAFLELI